MAFTLPKKKEHNFAAAGEQADQNYERLRQERLQTTIDQEKQILSALNDLGNGKLQDYQTVTSIPSQLQSYRMNLQRLQNYGYDLGDISGINSAFIQTENEVKNWLSKYKNEDEYNLGYYYPLKYKDASVKDLDNSLRGLKQQIGMTTSTAKNTKPTGDIRALGAGDSSAQSTRNATPDPQRAALQKEINWIQGNRSLYLTDDDVDNELTSARNELNGILQKIGDTAGTSEGGKGGQKTQRIKELRARISSLTAEKDQRAGAKVYNSFDQSTKDAFDKYGEWQKTVDSAQKKGAKWIGNDYEKWIGDNGEVRYHIKGTNSFAQSDEEKKYAEAASGLVAFRRKLRELGYDEGERKSILDRAVKQYNAQIAEGKQKKAADFAKDHEILATLAAIPLDLASGVGYLDQLGQYLTGGTDALTGEHRLVDTNRGASQIGLVSSTYTGTIAGELSEHGTLGEIASFLYQTGLSIAEFMAPVGAAGAVAKIGKGTEAALKLSSGITKLTTPLLGGAAASQTLQEARARGASDGQAIALATLSGIAETAFEEVSLDKLKAFQTTLSEAEQYTIREAILDVAKQGLVEGSEEFATTLANTVSDLLIMADRNSISQSVSQLMSQGYTRDEATKLAWNEWWKGIALDTLAGAMSGVAISGVGGAKTQLSNAKLGSMLFDSADDPQVGTANAIAYMEAALSDKYTDENSTARKIAENIAKNYKGADFTTKTPRAEMGRMVRAFVKEQREKGLKEVRQPKTLQQQIAEENQTRMVYHTDPVTGLQTAVQLSPIAETLVNKGFKAPDAVRISPVLERIVAGLPLTDQQINALDFRDTALAETISSLTGQSIDPEQTSLSDLKEQYRAAIKAQSDKVNALAEQRSAMTELQNEINERRIGGAETVQQQSQQILDEARAQVANVEEDTLRLDNGNIMTRSEFLQSFRMANPGSESAVPNSAVSQMFDNARAKAAETGGVLPAAEFTRAIQSSAAPAVRSEEAQAPAGEGETTPSAPARTPIDGETAPETTPEATPGTGEAAPEQGQGDPRERAEKSLIDDGAEKVFDGVFFKASENLDSPKKLTLAQEWSSSIAAEYLRPLGITAIVWDADACQGSNAFISDSTGIMYLNPELLNARTTIMQAIGHEITHPATNDRKARDGKAQKNDMAEKILGSIVALYEKGALRGELASQVEAYTTLVGEEGKSKLVSETAAKYQAFYAYQATKAEAAGDTEAAKKMWAEYDKVDDHFARQEIASDWIGMIFESPRMMEKLAGVRPNLVDRIFRKIRSIRNGNFIKVLNVQQQKAAEKELDKLLDEIRSAIDKSKLAALQPAKTAQQMNRAAKQAAAGAKKQQKAKSRNSSAVQRALARTANPNKPRKISGRVASAQFPKGSNAAKAVKALGPDAEVTVNKDGEMIMAQSEDGGTILYSIPSFWGEGEYYRNNPDAKSGEALLRKALQDNGHSKAEIDEVILGFKRNAEELLALSDRIKAEYGWSGLADHLMMEVMTDIRTGSQLMYTLTPNGDYNVNLDLALVCKKRVAYTSVLARLVRDGVLEDIEFGSAAVAKVNEILRDSGFETACLGCFVEARRIDIQNWAENFVEEWNKAVEERVPNAGYFNFTHTNNPQTGAMENTAPAITKDDVSKLDKLYETNVLNELGNIKFTSKSPEPKIAELFSKPNSDVLLHKMRPADLLTPEGVTNLRKTDPTLFSLVKSRYGARSPKVLQEFHPYTGDMAEAGFLDVIDKTGKSFDGVSEKSYRERARDMLKKKSREKKADYEIRMRKLGFDGVVEGEDYDKRVDALALRLYLYDVGGARIQSFSDFMIENVFDYLQIIADLSASRDPMHGYTKEIIALKLFGMTGIKWNGSLIAHVDPAMGKAYAGLMPVEEATNGQGIVITGPAEVTENGEAIGEAQYAICFDDYERNVRTGKPAKDFLREHGGKVEDLSEAERKEYERLKKQQSYIQSIGMKDIFALMMDPRYSKNIGNITIGVSDVQILAMLRSDLFTMVIPYHKSGLPSVYAELMGIQHYNDYSDFQETKLDKIYTPDGKVTNKTLKSGGKAIHADKSFNFNAALQRHKGNARDAATEYVKWCRSKHEVRDSKGNLLGYETFKPKFSDSPNHFNFTNEPNYYKLLEDFTALDPVTGEWTPQGPVRQYVENEDGTYDLTRPLLPDASNRLTPEQAAQYRENLQRLGLFSEAQIDDIVQKANRSFSELVEAEVTNRAKYHQATDPLYEETVGKIKEALSAPEFQKPKEVRAAERQAYRDEKEAAKAKKKEKKDAGEVRHSVPNSFAALDSDYMAAMESGDMEAAQRMVDEAARRAGYTIKGWHGTGSRPFTKFNFGRSGIYITTDEEVARTYGSNVMHLYGTENNQLTIDADGHTHFDLPIPEWLRTEIDKYPLMRGKSDTDTLARVARNLGYSSLRIKNIDDSASLASDTHKLADDVVYFESLDNLNFKNSQVKSAETIVYDDDGNVIPLSERFNPESDDIRHMFAGESSLLADMTALQEAKDMEAQGKTADEIRQQTGWFRGADTRWRYEIDDSRMTFHPKGSAKIWNDYPDYPNFYELEKRVIKGETLNDYEQKRFEELKNKFAPLRKKLNKEGRQHIRDGTATLDEVMVHPELFSAYPGLRKVHFQIANIGPANRFGEYNPAANRVTLNENAAWYDPKTAYNPPKDPKLPMPPGAPDHRTMQSTLLHETQHSVQRLEGFGSGGNHGWMGAQKRSATTRARDARRVLSAEARKLFDEFTKVYNRNDPAAGEAIEKRAKSELASYADLAKFEEAVDWFKLSKDPRDSFQMYLDLTGEQEARDTQYRRTMTDAQRRRYTPNLGESPMFPASPFYRKGPTNKSWNKPSGRYSITQPVPGMYNLSERVLDGIKQDKLGAASVVNMLRGKGVKTEEIKWLGIEDFLKGKKSVTKQELLDWIRANDLVLEEETLGSGRPGFEFINADRSVSYQNYEEAREGALVLADIYGYSEDDVRYDGDYGFYAHDPETEEDEILVRPFDWDEDDGAVEDETHWSDYTTPGGENYREVLFRMPGNDYVNSASEAHWKNKAPGVMAHARVQDFNTADGGTVLFIDEIQSDWHNAGQKRGYRAKGDLERAVDEWSIAKANRNVFRESGKFEAVLDKLRPLYLLPKDPVDARRQIEQFVDYALTDSGTSGLLDRVERFNERNPDQKIDWTQEDTDTLNQRLDTEKAYRAGAASWSAIMDAVPDAPFAKNYTDFVLKRLLREAAENGYDGLAWTTAEMQADRWSDEYMEGYRIEYDQDIPKFLNKFGKKFGAKVGTTELSNGETVPYIPITDSMRESVMTEGMPRFSIDPTLFQTPEFRSYYNDLLESRGLTQQNIQRQAAQTPAPRVSNVRTHTLAESNILNRSEQIMDGLSEEDFTYNPDTEIQSMQRAKDRLDADFNGEYERLRQDGLNTNDDVDASMGILSELLAHARETNDYSEVTEFLQDIRSEATRAGQLIQAFAKYNRTPEGVLRNAAEALAESNLTEDEQNAIMERIGQFAQTLKAIERGRDGDREDLINLILDQANMRNTHVSRWTLRDLGEQEISYLYDAALNQMDQIAKDYIRANAGKQIATYQTISHLFNLRTAGRNVVSNASFNPFATIANDFAMIPDLITRIFTGRRTVGMDWGVLTPGRRAAGRAAGRTAAVELALDIDPTPNRRDKYGTARRTWKMTGNLAARTGSRIEKAMGYELNWTDERHKGRVKAQIEHSLRGLVASGAITQEMATQWAEQEALYRAFQDDTFPGRLLAVLKRGGNMIGVGQTGEFLLPGQRGPLHQFGVGDLLVKYTQVPGALIQRAVEFSPLGYLRALYHLIQMPGANREATRAAQNLAAQQAKLDRNPSSRALMNRVLSAQNTATRADMAAATQQREFALAMGRATTGVGLIKLFAMAAALGLLRRADDEEDDEVRAMLTSQGMTGTQFNPDALLRLIQTGKADWQDGDHLWAVDFLEPLNALMTIGFKINASIEEDDTFWERMDKVVRRGTVDGIWDTIGELSVMQTLGTIQQSLKYAKDDDPLTKPEQIAIELFSSSVSGFVPSPIRQLAQATDTVQRDTYTSKNVFQSTLDKMRNSVPGLRQQLPEKLDNYGEARKLEDQPLNALNSFLIPGSIRTFRQSDEAKVLDQVAKASGVKNFYPDRNAPYKENLTIDGEKVLFELSPEEREQYQTTRGQTLYTLHKAMMKDTFFTTATPSEQADMLSAAKELASYVARQELAKNQKDLDYTNAEQEKNLGALGVGYTMASWFITKAAASSAEGEDADGDGKTDDGSKKKEALQNIQTLNINDEQKAYWFHNSSYDGEDKDKIENAAAQGIRATTYIDAQIKLADAHGEDLDGDGKTDSGSKMKNEAAIINSLPLTIDQKRWLFFQIHPTSTKFESGYTWTDTSGN